MKRVLLVLLCLFFSSSHGDDQASLDLLKLQMANRVVYIASKVQGSWCYGQGSIISADGFVLTAKHVTEGSADYQCYRLDSSGKEHVQRASLVAEHPFLDVSILKLSSDNLELPFFTFEEKPVQIDQWIFLGYYYQGEQRVLLRGGKVLYMQFSLTSPEVYTSLSSSPGDSGGPCLQDEGKIVGVYLGRKIIPFEHARFVPYTAIKDWMAGLGVFAQP